jgi:outer membrane protein OmpA-like peptidoglycan-associated protein
MASQASMSMPMPPAHTAPATNISAPSANLAVDFETGSAALTPRAMATLDELGKALTSPQLAAFNFKIAGHTDTVGDMATNQTLSEQRAQAVKSYLETKYNISDARLQAVGLGETDLLVQTPPNTPSQLNRRVQIINLGQ